MLAYLTQSYWLKTGAQQSFDEALKQTLHAREMRLDSEGSSDAATDVFVRFLTQGSEGTLLKRGDILLGRVDNARPLAVSAQGVRKSLSQALAQSSPSYRAALAFVQAAGDRDLVAEQLLGAKTRHRHMSLQAHVQELFLLWQERMLDERAALRYAQAAPACMLETLAGPAGMHYANLTRVMRRYGPALLQPVNGHAPCWSALTRQQHKRLQEIDHLLRLCHMAPLPKVLMHQENLSHVAPDVAQAQHRVLGMCQSIDIVLLRGVFQTRQAMRFAQLSPALHRAREQDIMRAVREAQTQLGPHTIEAQLGSQRQISSATFSANASMSTGLRK